MITIAFGTDFVVFVAADYHQGMYVFFYKVDDFLTSCRSPANICISRVHKLVYAAEYLHSGGGHDVV